MTEHRVTVDTTYVDALLHGDKPFEVRRNDRGYQAGDILVMMEDGDPGEDRHWASTDQHYPGWARCSRCRPARVLVGDITYVYSGDPRWDHLSPGVVVLGLRNVVAKIPT